MPLNELVKEYSLQTVSEKTKISIGSLEKLKDREWEALREPQVIGFIRIIEKKYSIDLSELEQEARAYYKEHKGKESHNPIDIVGVAELKSESKLISGFVTLLSLAVVAYATWYYLQDHNRSSGTSSESNSSKKGMFAETLTNVKSLLGMESLSKATSHDGNETNGTQVVDSNSTASMQQSEEKKDKAKEQTKSETIVAPQEHKKFDLVSIDSNGSNSTVVDTNRGVASGASNNSSENFVREESINSLENVSNETDVSIQALELNNSMQSESQEDQTSDAIIVTGTNIDTSQEQSKLQESNISSSDMSEQNSSEGNDSTKSAPSKVVISEITIKPLSKRLWLGVYDLKRGKRINKFITSTLKFPVDSSYAIITGHSKLEISGDSIEAMRFPNRGRVYLLVSPEGVKSIDKMEYKQITKGRAW